MRASRVIHSARSVGAGVSAPVLARPFPPRSRGRADVL